MARSPLHFHFLSAALWLFKGSFQVNRDPQVGPQGGALNAFPLEANTKELNWRSVEDNQRQAFCKSINTCI